MRSRSLASRLLILMAMWLLVALIVTGGILSTLFRQNAESNFEELLLAHAYNLMGAIDVDAKGVLTGQPNLGDPRFLTPFSGWYWSVSSADFPNQLLLHSRSITDEEIAIPASEQQPFDSLYRRSYVVNGNNNSLIQHVEAQLYLGDSEKLYQVLVAGNTNEVSKAVNKFNKSLAGFFFTFGLGTIIATYFAIGFGLKPLARTADVLHTIREGQAERLDGNFPKEIKPLVEEINGLIAANKSVTERARTQVGNLAHALKTPLAVILNEVRKPTKNLPKRVSEQAERMESQIGIYLDRARIAAQKGALSRRTPVAPIIDRILRVVGKLSPHVQFDCVMENEEITFKGEAQDLEEVLGNLLENAARYARKTVKITTNVGQGIDPGYFQITIEDDGCGIDARERESALGRGKRLDESKPGSGLGLSIVHDIAKEYDGHFELGKSSLGGLKAAVNLPRTSLRSTR